MALNTFVAELVRHAYWNDDISCVPTVLRTLGKLFELEISEQVYDSCWGFNGAGKYGAQCGLFEGTLMFISLLTHREGIDNVEMWQACYDYAAGFERHFGSLRCCELRPGGFSDDDPPHMCEALTVETIVFSARFIADWFGFEIKIPGPEPTEKNVT